MDPQWGSDCTETLHLLSLYGPDGSRYEDSRVSDMLMVNDPPPTARPSKRLLRLLREIDKTWVREHSEASSPRDASPDYQ
jgi:hypothetical protein